MAAWAAQNFSTEKKKFIQNKQTSFYKSDADKKNLCLPINELETHQVFWLFWLLTHPKPWLFILKGHCLVGAKKLTGWEFSKMDVW